MSPNRWSFAAGVLILALFSNAAIAQNEIYLFGALGNTNSDIALGSINRVDSDGGSYALGAGYAFNRHFSVEAAYTDFGSLTGETDCPPLYACLIIPVSAQADLTAVSLSAIVNFPITKKVAAYGKAGFASWDLGFGGISSAFDTSGEDVLYGAGLRWSISDRWKVFAEYGRLDLGLDTASAGLSYSFKL
jgi:opacity protein-like surface antigen